MVSQPSRKRPTKPNVQKLKELAKTNLTHEEIAKDLGLERSTVTKAIKRLGIECAEVEDFKKRRADVFASMQLDAIKAITPEKLEKSSAYQLYGMTSLIYDKERLERGLSTDHIILYSVHQHVVRELFDPAKQVQSGGQVPLIEDNSPDNIEDPTTIDHN